MKITQEFWAAVNIPPQPAIAALYDYVLSRSEKRSPAGTASVELPFISKLTNIQQQNLQLTDTEKVL